MPYDERDDQERKLVELARSVSQLEHALRSRSVIDQAIGVLMAQEKCTAEAAFDLLRRHSQNSNRKLRDVAADVITRLTGHPPSEPPQFRHSESADGAEVRVHSHRDSDGLTSTTD